jgi:hypothetical protein
MTGLSVALPHLLAVATIQATGSPRIKWKNP